jgi:hypothetical protein
LAEIFWLFGFIECKKLAIHHVRFREMAVVASRHCP